MNNLICNTCGNTFKAYWLKDGKCNGCANSSLIVNAITNNEEYEMRQFVNIKMVAELTTGFPSREQLVAIGYKLALQDYGIWKDGIRTIGCMETPIVEIITELELTFNIKEAYGE